jgi:hypothetical protein
MSLIFEDFLGTTPNTAIQEEFQGCGSISASSTRS